MFTGLDAVIHLTDTTSRTILDIAAITKQVDVVRILLNSGKFNEEEKFNALRLAIIQGNVREVKAFLDYVNDESRKAALKLAMNNTQEEITHVLLNFITSETTNVEENRAKPCRSNGNIDNRPVATVPTVSTNGNNNEGETHIIPETKQTTTLNNDNKANGFVYAQFSPTHEKETKYKESKECFYTSLSRDTVGVVVTGLFIAAAVMVPSVAGAVVCGIAATLVAIATGLHIANSTLPSYRKMRENKIEHVNSSLRNQEL